MRKLLIVVVMLMACAAGKKAEEPKGAPFEMESYQLVLLKRGASWTKDVTPETERIQKEHLAHLGAMADTGKMVLAGPLSDQPDETLRGICIYRTASLDEAKKLAEDDPAVKSGRLKVEVMTWWVGKGYVAFPKAPPQK